MSHINELNAMTRERARIREGVVKCDIVNVEYRQPDGTVITKEMVPLGQVLSVISTEHGHQ